MTSAPVFEVRNVFFAYDNKQTALENVDLTVRSGESLVILGANGSGKSTLLKILDGLYFPTQGEITAFGEPLTEARLRDDAFNFAFRRRQRSPPGSHHRHRLHGSHRRPPCRHGTPDKAQPKPSLPAEQPPRMNSSIAS